MIFLVRKNPSSCDDIEIRTFVPTSEGFEVLPAEPPGLGEQRVILDVGKERRTVFRPWVIPENAAPATEAALWTIGPLPADSR